jgi:hypothetical protein
MLIVVFNVSIGQSAISTMTSTYLIGEEKESGKRKHLYTIHYSIKLIPKAQKERTTQYFAAEKSSSSQDRNTSVGVANAAGATFRVVLPPVSYLRLRRQLRASHRRH